MTNPQPWIRPIKDRVLCTRAPIRDISPILNVYAEQQSTINTTIPMNVVSIGPDVRDEFLVVGSIALIESVNLINLVRSHDKDGLEYWIFHEGDIFGVELQED